MSTEAGRRLLELRAARDPSMDSFGDLEFTAIIAAIEAEAVAAERKRIAQEAEWLTLADATDDTKPTVYWDGWLAALDAVLAIVEPGPVAT